MINGRTARMDILVSSSFHVTGKFPLTSKRKNADLNLIAKGGLAMWMETKQQVKDQCACPCHPSRAHMELLQQSCLPPKNGKRKERHQFHVPQVKSVHGRCSKAKLWWCCGTCLPHQQQDSWRLWHVGIVSGSCLISQRTLNSTYSNAWTWSLLLLCDHPDDYVWGQPPYFFYQHMEARPPRLPPDLIRVCLQTWYP